VKITVLSHFYPPEIGAAQRRLDAFVSRWVEDGQSVRVVTALPHYPRGKLQDGYKWSRSFRRESGPHGEEVIRVPFFPASNARASKLLDYMTVSSMLIVPAATRAGDVVLATAPPVPILVPAFVASRVNRIPLVLEMRDAWPDLIYEAGVARGAMGKRVVSLVSKAQRSAERVVTVSQDFASILVDRGVNADRVQCISNGIDIEVVPLLPPPTRGDELKVLYLGTHGVSQDLETAINALARVGREKVNARFVGDGTEKNRLRRLSSELGAPVTFEEPVRGARLWETYQWADVCLVTLKDWPSFRYTIPSKIYEILACGRFILGSVEGEAARVIEQSSGGVAVKSGDVDALSASMERLVMDRNVLNVGEVPRRWVAEHAGYHSLATKYLELLRDVVRR